MRPGWGASEMAEAFYRFPLFVLKKGVARNLLAYGGVPHLCALP
jgi:hypothetical protein